MWLPLAQRALATEGQPEGVSFSFNLDTGALSWTWPAREVGMSAAAQQSVLLRPVAAGDGDGGGGGGPGGAAGGGGHGAEDDDGGGGGGGGSGPLEAMLATVWESCYRLLLSCRQLDSELTRQSRSLAATRRELQECTEKHKGLVEELHIKFARVLDAKKERLIQQRNRIQELEEQLRAAQQELAEAEAAQTDEEGEGPGPSDERAVAGPLGRGSVEPEAEAAAGPSTSAPPARGGDADAPPSSTTAAAAAAGRGPAAWPSALLPAGPTLDTSRVEPIGAPYDSLRPAGTSTTGGPPPPGPPPSAVVLLPGGALSTVGDQLAEAMEVDGVGVSDVGPSRGLPGSRRGPLARWVAAAETAGSGGTYASLGATQLDEELMMATTQPAAWAVPPQVPQPAVGQPPGPAPLAAPGGVPSDAMTNQAPQLPQAAPTPLPAVDQAGPGIAAGAAGEEEGEGDGWDEDEDLGLGPRRG